MNLAKFLILMLWVGASAPSWAAGPALPGKHTGCMEHPAMCWEFIPVGPTLVSLPGKPTPAWGRTIAEIPTLFAHTILVNFETNKSLNAMITGMDNVMLARLSTELKAHDTQGDTPLILEYAARQLSAANLHRLEAAFGPSLVGSALAYAPAAVQASYADTPNIAPLFLSAYWWALGNTSTDNSGQLYLYDIFLDSYTASAGGPPVNALKDTSRYMNVVVKNSVVVEVIVVTAAIFAILDSPSAKAVYDAIADWWFLTAVDANNFMRAITVPAPTLDPPPPLDVPLPQLPPIADDPELNSDVLCTDIYGCMEH